MAYRHARHTTEISEPSPEFKGSYTKALEMCKEARDQGWAGNWTWKIGCLAKQRQAQDTGVTYISKSGITPI